MKDLSERNHSCRSVTSAFFNLPRHGNPGTMTNRLLGMEGLGGERKASLQRVSLPEGKVSIMEILNVVSDQ